MRKFKSGAIRDTDEGKPDYSGFLSETALVRVDAWVLRERELAWAGGLFEGEGYIGVRSNVPELQMKMCDEDAVRLFAEIVGEGKVYGPYIPKATKAHQPIRPWRPYFSWQARADAAVRVGKLLFPYLQSRRRAVLREKWGIQRIAVICGFPPNVLVRYGEYMLKHQVQADGTLRSSSNWKNGIPPAVYMSSAWRHLLDVMLHHWNHGEGAKEPLEDALCGLLFNVMGYLHELLGGKGGT